eukprot:1116204-Pleurochrysis_carterae.AAC.1
MHGVGGGVVEAEVTGVDCRLVLAAAWHEGRGVWSRVLEGVPVALHGGVAAKLACADGPLDGGGGCGGCG